MSAVLKHTNYGDLLDSVLDAMANYGLAAYDATDLRLDGVLCRFSTSERDYRERKRNGWMVCFTTGPRPVVVFGDWSTHLHQAVPLGAGGGSLSPGERELQRQAFERARADREVQLKFRQRQAQMTARQRWERAQPAKDSHPYLVRKRVNAAGLRQDGDSLLVPMRDHEGNLWSIQTIRLDGNKRFLKGGRVQGLYFSAGGPLGDHLLICEGMATGKSLHAATGLPVAAAMSAGNLPTVAKRFRDQYPNLRITICADNDVREDGRNPGVAAATDAARAVGGYLAVPSEPGDYNDMAVRYGINTAMVTDNDQIPN